MKSTEKQTIDSGNRDEKKGQISRSTAPQEINRHPSQARVIEFLPKGLSIEILRTIWNDEEVNYSDEELFRIKDWFYTIAELTLSTLREKGEKETKIKASPDAIPYPDNTIPQLIQDKHPTKYDEAASKSYTLRPRIHRRTG